MNAEYLARDIKMHKESCGISLMLHQPTPWPAIEGQRASIPSCHAMSFQRQEALIHCVARTARDEVVLCESLGLSSGILQPAAIVPGVHMHVSDAKGHSLTNKMLNTVSAERKQYKREIRPQLRYQTGMSGIPTDNIQPAGTRE